MLSILVTVLVCWLAYKTLGILLSLTWGLAKIMCTVLLILAAPALVIWRPRRWLQEHLCWERHVSKSSGGQLK